MHSPNKAIKSIRFQITMQIEHPLLRFLASAIIQTKCIKKTFFSSFEDDFF